MCVPPPFFFLLFSPYSFPFLLQSPFLFWSQTIPSSNHAVGQSIHIARVEGRMLAKICISGPKQDEEGVHGGWKVSPSMRCQNLIKVSWAGRWGWLLSMGYQLSGGLGRASAEGWVWQSRWETGYLPWGLYQISKYIKNDISHVSHWQAGVSPEKRKKLK